MRRERRKKHVYETNGASRDPSCRICGENSWDDKYCFGSYATLQMYRKIARLKKELRKAVGKK